MKGDEIQMTIPGEPQALKRHRSFSRGSFNGTYDPSKNDKKSFLSLAYEHRPSVPLDCALDVDMKFYFSRPKSHYGTGKNAGVLKKNAPKYKTSRPDKDNLEKFVYDALDKVFWRDDSIVVRGVATKLYGDTPRIEVSIKEMKDNFSG